MMDMSGIGKYCKENKIYFNANVILTEKMNEIDCAGRKHFPASAAFVSLHSRPVGLFNRRHGR